MRLLLVLPFVAALAACDPYSPNLGDHPFRCGAHDPKCPDGYTCDTNNTCVRGATGPDAASVFTCNDDHSIEPNETLQTAFVTPIPDVKACVSMINLAICPTSDKDLFRFRVDSVMSSRTTITTDVAQGRLDLQMLNSAGAVIGNGSVLDSQHIQLIINNLAPGAYYVQVSAGGGIENNYSLEIITCNQSGCPQPCS